MERGGLVTILTHKLISLFFVSVITTTTAVTAETTGEWLGAYLNQTKVGWSFLSITPPDTSPVLTPSEQERLGPRGEGQPYLLLSESRMGVMAYGKRKQIYWRTLAYLKSDYSLARFAFHMEGDGASSDFSGYINGNVIELTILSSGDSRKETIPISDSPVFLAEVLARRAAEALGRGEAVDGEYQVVEPHQVSVSNWKLNLEGKEDLQINGQSFGTYRLKEDAGGFTTQTWVAETGHVVKEWAPLADGVGYLSLVESEKEAKDLEFINPDLKEELPASTSNEPDLMYSTSVDGGKEIPHPTQVRRLVVELSNFTLSHPFPFCDYQRNLGQESQSYTNEAPLRLEILQVPPPTESQMVETSPLPENLQKYLEPEPLVQSDHPEIMEHAKTIAAGVKGNWNKALAIQAWMAEHIQPEFRITLPSAIEVLHSGKGDCNEQSALFAALARAAGVPTRICTGLVYQRKAFYYHAWDEVLVSTTPERWIPIDPVLKQTQPDATHIKFGEGGLSEQAYITGLIGKIRARIIEFQTDDPDPATHSQLRP